MWNFQFSYIVINIKSDMNYFISFIKFFMKFCICWYQIRLQNDELLFGWNCQKMENLQNPSIFTVKKQVFQNSVYWVHLPGYLLFGCQSSPDITWHGKHVKKYLQVFPMSILISYCSVYTHTVVRNGNKPPSECSVDFVKLW